MFHSFKVWISKASMELILVTHTACHPLVGAMCCEDLPCLGERWNIVNWGVKQLYLPDEANIDMAPLFVLPPKELRKLQKGYFYVVIGNGKQVEQVL